jgi:hypothetical protein
MKRIVLNRSVSFAERNGVYAVYIDFNFMFFRGVAAQLLGDILTQPNAVKQLDLANTPGDFVEFLVLKKILKEEQVL